jgi:hypothetical protein
VFGCDPIPKFATFMGPIDGMNANIPHEYAIGTPINAEIK